MIVDREFQKQIDYIDLESIKKSQDVICIVDHDLRLRAFNDAWVAFAENNGGGSITRQYPLGSVITDAGEEPIKSYIRKKYRHAIALKKPFEMSYECSSSALMRLFRLSAYPLVGQRGLVISHHLVKECPHEETVQEFHQQFVNREGLIIQCQNCRKIRDPQNKNSWLWVPSLLEKNSINFSHSICDRCMDYYYPDLPLSELLAVRRD